MVPRENQEVKPIHHQPQIKSEVFHEEPKMKGSKMLYNTYEKK